MSEPKMDIKNESDAMLWLSYFARFAGGELAESASGIRGMMIALQEKLQVTRDRCAALAKTIEIMQAKNETPKADQ